MPTEYKNCMTTIEDAQKEDKRCIVFEGTLNATSIKKLEADAYTVRSFTVKDPEKPDFKRTVIAWCVRHDAQAEIDKLLTKSLDNLKKDIE